MLRKSCIRSTHLHTLSLKICEPNVLLGVHKVVCLQSKQLNYHNATSHTAQDNLHGKLPFWYFNWPAQSAAGRRWHAAMVEASMTPCCTEAAAS